MPLLKPILLLVMIALAPGYGFSQQRIDTAEKLTTFSGSLGLTNNGFSIIPTFSLNSPATLILLSWRKNKFSIDPDVRLTLNAKKGSMVFWFRYHVIEAKKFKLRVGVHPAFNLQTREIVSNGDTNEITQMRRFLAWELAPGYQLNKHWSIGIYYLQGNGLQKDGPRTTHFINLNTTVSNVKAGGRFRLAFSPAVYYLYLDGYHGEYFTSTATLSNTELPFTIQSAINKTFSSNIPGNKDFLWNISIHYNFNKSLVAKK